VDHGVGIDVIATVGAPVRRGDPVLFLECDDVTRRHAALAIVAGAIEIGDDAMPATELLIETVTAGV
jgi:thymidine phosphorylase